MTPQDLWYQFPEGAYLILFSFIFLILFWWLYIYRKKKLAHFSSKENLEKLLVPRSESLYFVKAICFSAIWLLAVFALMQPKGNGYYPNAEMKNDELKLKPHDLIFLIDASASMSISDNPSHKTRLGLAKEIADEITSGLAGENAALYAFTSVATKMSPPTPDLFFVRLMLRQIAINEGGIAGTDFYAALKTINEKYFKEKEDSLRTLIILSDGQDTHLDTLTGNEKQEAIDQIVNLLGDPKNLNLRVFTIGIGSSNNEAVPGVQFNGQPVYSKLDDELLKLLSTKGRGVYYQADKETPIDIAKHLLKKLNEDNIFIKEDLKNEASQKELLVYQLFFQIPLGLSLFLLSFYLLFPDASLFSFIRLSSILLCCFHLPFLSGDETANLRQAKLFFEAGDFSKSDSIYNEMLKQKLDPFEKAVVMYNQGTAYIAQNELQKAVEVLEIIPLKGNPPPFLTRRIKTNLALAKFRQALKVLSSENPDQNTLEKAAYLLKLSEREIEKAKNADCELQKLEGRKTCDEAIDLKELSLATKEHLEKLSKLVNLEALDSDPQSAKSLARFRKNIADISGVAMKIKPQNIKELNDILKKAILAEHETLMMTRNLNGLNEVKEESIEALKSAQTEVLKIADYYLSETTAMQKRLYETTGLQKKPWNEILPLYNKGYQAANEALDFISENLERASLKQEEAIKYWKEASESRDESQEENKPESQEEVNQNKSEQALKLLQEMQNNEPRQKQNTKTSKQEVERPW